MTLAILAGGNATRMGGRNKALIEIEGETFIKRIYKNLSPLFDNTIIISNEQIDFGISGVSVYPDIYRNNGPLGGIHSAMVNSKSDLVFVVSCDMPFANASVAKKIINAQKEEGSEVVAPEMNGLLEPLFAIYSKKLADRAEAIILSSEKKYITKLLDKSNTYYLYFNETPEVKKCFTNVNSPDDLFNLKS